MNTRNKTLLHRIGAVFGAWGSAVSVVNAAEAGRQPRALDLKRLGIDAEAYRGIGRF